MPDMLSIINTNSILRAIPLERFQRVQAPRWNKKQTILSLSLFNGRMKALSIINSSIHAGWEKPEEVTRHELRHAVQEAIHHTQYTGADIAILIDDPRFATCTFQVPPMELSDLLPLLERKVHQEKTVEGPAAWRYRVGLESRGKRNIHLEIWPQEVVEDIVQMCQDVQLHLRQLLPLSALAESQLGTLPVEAGEGRLLISMMQKKTMFIAGRDDGTPCWIRHLLTASDGLPLAERIGTEVNRTMMFLTQQANITFSRIWFLGEEEKVTVNDIQPYVSTPVLPFPMTPDWKFWLWVGANIPITHPTNFTPPHVLQAPLRQMLKQVGTAMIAGFVLLGVGTTSMIEGYLAKNPFNAQTVTRRISRLQHEHEQWKTRLRLLQTNQQWVQAVNGLPDPGVEGAFLGYLGTIVPAHMVLHRVLLERTQDKWNLELDGSLATDLSTALLVGNQFMNQLAKSPFHVSMDSEWRHQLLTQRTKASTSSPERPLLQFSMKGIMS